MIFTIVICILLIAIAFFHYLQGFFSGVISAIISIIAAVLAFSWHETVVDKLLGGKMANMADGMVLVVLFAAIYLILRTVFDKAVPGNVRVPAALDRIGGGIMGLIAGVYALGILAIAAQELPFGPTVAGFAKYDVGDRAAQIALHPGGQNQDGWQFDTLKSDEAGKFDENDRKVIFPPVDDIVVGTVRRLSEIGSMQGSQPLSSVHPDFLEELFGERTGVQAGANHVTINLPQQTEKAVEVGPISIVNQVKVEDPVADTIRRGATPKVPLNRVRQIEETVGMDGRNQPILRKTDIDNARSGQIMLVVRLYFGIDATDRDDGLVRFSTGSVRILGYKQGTDPVTGKTGLIPHDYFPIGTLEFDSKHPELPILFADKPDDYLMVDVRGHPADTRPGVDLVFVVEKAGFLQGSSRTIASGSFLEYKRMIREDLGGKKVAGAWLRPDTNKETIDILHQTAEFIPTAPAPNMAAPRGGGNPGPRAANTPRPAPANPTPANPTPAPAIASGGGVLTVGSVQQSAMLPSAIGVPNAELAKPLISLPGVPLLTLKDKKILDIDANAEIPLADLAKGDVSTRDLMVPDTRKLVQIVCTAPAGDPWGWAQKAASLTLTDSVGGSVPLSGVFAVVHDADGDKLFAHYSSDPDSPLTQDRISPIPAQGTPTNIYLAFMLPNGAKAKELKLDGKILKSF